ncbi:MAG TPA: PaaI family thioesterase [Microscillaceae bacterium]|nr:PaaI family thioesterase [Microscillaceae bacterium]
MNNPLYKLFESQVGKPMKENAPPFTQWLEPTLKSVTPGQFELEITVRKEMTNPLGLLHGGVQAAILDEVIGMTVASLDKPLPAVSVNLNVDFLGKARVGDIIVAKSNVVRQGRQIINMTGELYNQEGKLIARAMSNMLQIEMKKK